MIECHGWESNPVGFFCMVKVMVMLNSIKFSLIFSCKMTLSGDVYFLLLFLVTAASETVLNTAIDVQNVTVSSTKKMIFSQTFFVSFYDFLINSF